LRNYTRAGRVHDHEIAPSIYPSPLPDVAQKPGNGEAEERLAPTAVSPFPGHKDDDREFRSDVTEVPETIPRRRFTAEYTICFLQEADACPHGQLSALLRREGLSSSHIKDWRKQRDIGALDALSRKRGRKKKAVQHPLVSENARLQKEMRRLEDELRKARILIEYPKKMADLLGEPMQGDSS